MPDIDPIHLLIRFSDGSHPTGHTIESHQAVIRAQGAVWLGKLGRTVAARHIERINEQCRNGIPSFIYLVQKVGRRYQAHRGQIVELARNLPRRANALVPSYYSEDRIRKYVSFWAKLSRIDRLDERALSRLYIASSFSPVTDTLALSMAGMFLVKERGSSMPTGTAPASAPAEELRNR